MPTPARAPGRRARNATAAEAPAAVAPNGQAVAVHALWHIGGSNIWPFDGAKQTALVAAISDILAGMLGALKGQCAASVTCVQVFAARGNLLLCAKPGLLHPQAILWDAL